MRADFQEGDIVWLVDGEGRGQVALLKYKHAPVECEDCENGYECSNLLLAATWGSERHGGEHVFPIGDWPHVTLMERQA